MSNITIEKNKVIIDGHANDLETCNTLTNLCDELNKSDKFKTVKYESGYGEFESIMENEEKKFVASYNLYICSNDGSTILESTLDALGTLTVTSNGLTDYFTYSGSKIFAGLSTTPNATTPTYVPGDIIDPVDIEVLYLYIVESNLTLSGLFTQIANAIRGKTGETATIKATNFPSKIAGISTGVAKPSWVQSTLPTSGSWDSVCYGGGKFVAIADYNSNAAAYSTDGINWTQTTMPVSSYWRAACYGGGKFVALSYNTAIAAYSTDGINWTQTTMPGTRKWTSVCYGNGKFVAMAEEAILPAYSTDGITWTSARMPSGTSLWTSVCYGNGKFVATTYANDIAAYSTDGINWTQTTMPSSGFWYGICYGNGKFVTASLNTAIAAYSTDGINWTQTTMPTTASWRSIGYGNGKFVAVGSSTSTVAAYSTDGINWMQATMPAYATWHSVCCGDGKFVVSSTGTRVAYLKDSFDEWA